MRPHPKAKGNVNQRRLMAQRIEGGLPVAQAIIECWRREYNTFRPHSSLGYRLPAPETVHWTPWPRNGKLLLALT